MSLIKGYSMIAFGGGACVLPFLNLFGTYKGIPPALPPSNQQTIASSAKTHTPSSDTDSGRDSQQSHLREAKHIKEKDNCRFTTKKEGGLDSEIEGSYSDYFSFDCDNSGQNEEILTAKWTIWVPKVLLKEGKDKFEEEQRVNIKTTSLRKSSETYENETTFDSEIFLKGPVKGTWGEDIVGISEEDSQAFIYRVTITSPVESKSNLLYLRWK